MSHRFYSSGITRCKPRRTWWNTVKDLVALLALSALAGWLLSCVKHASLPVPVRLPGLAMATWLEGMIIGGLALGTVAGIWFAVMKMQQHEMDAAAAWSRERWEDENAPFDAFPMAPFEDVPPAWEREGFEVLPMSRFEDPLAEPWTGIAPDEMRRILAAVIANTSEARDHVWRSNKLLAASAKLIYCPQCGMLSGSVPPVDQKLTIADERLHGVLLCLGKLADRFKEPAAEPADVVTVTIRMDSTALEQGFERNRGLVKAFVSSMLRARWVKAYESAAASYKPQHGGYGA